jgi:methionine-S-sulfoxide reductase
MTKFYTNTQDFINNNKIYKPYYNINTFDIYNFILSIEKDDKVIYAESKTNNKLIINGNVELIDELVSLIFISNLKISGIKGEATITKRFIECYSKYFDGKFTKDEDGYIYKEGSLKVVIFAGGCFWCAANNFYSLKGVKEVYSGYASGDVFFPTYEEVKTGLTGHKESIFIYYNEEEVSYRELIIAFFENIDPFDEDGQFIDRGSNYQTAVFTDDDGQVELFYRAKKYIETNYGGEVKVRLLPNVVFFLAEEDHQEFSIKNKERFLEEEKLSGRNIYQGVKFK